MSIKKMKRKRRTARSKTRRLLVEFYNIYDPNCSGTHNGEQLEIFLRSKQSYPTHKYAMFRRHWCILIIRRNENVPLTEAFQIYDSWRQGRRKERYAYYNSDSNDQNENYKEDDEDDDEEDDKDDVVDDVVVDAATQRKPTHSSPSSPPKKKRGKTTHENAAAVVAVTRDQKKRSDAAVAIEEQEHNNASAAVKAEVDAKVKAKTAVLQEELEKLVKEKETKESAEQEKKIAEKAAPAAAAARQKEESSNAAVTNNNNNNDEVAATAIVCMGASASASANASTIQQLPTPPLTITNTNTDTNTLLLFPTGTIISKQFEAPDGPYYEGSIISYDTHQKFYQIKYNDGDREDFTHDEVHYHRPTQTSTTSSANDSIHKHNICKPNNNTRWNKKFQQLSAYQKTKGNANVPQIYQADPQLGSWVHNQRKAYNNKKLSNERIEQLDTIKFVWDAQQALWFGMYNELVSYQKQYHDTLVPRRQYLRQLYYWVILQRSAYNDGTLSEERMDLLNLIGFV